MSSIRARLMIALILLVALASSLSAALAYRRVLDETSTLFDYQLRQMALSLRGQMSLAPRIEVPNDQADSDFVVQIWDLYGARIYQSRPGLPVPNQAVLGFGEVSLRGHAWRTYGLQTDQGVIQVAQPLRVREVLASAAAWRVTVPLLLVLPVALLIVMGVVQSGLLPLRAVIREVRDRGAGSLAALDTSGLPMELEPMVSEFNRLLERLRAAFAAQRDFVADAAHELRSPLTSLRLQLQLLDRAPDEAARREARDMLGSSVERAIHMVEQLLTLARLEPREAGKILEKADLAAVIRLAMGDCHALAQSRGLDLGLDAPTPVMVRGDDESLRILGRNLVDNALRYSPPGGVVQVVCRVAGPVAELEVQDSGPGIAALDRERIFDRFYRVNTAQEGGTGLGLAIVRAIALQHGAKVQLDDAAGGGLRVRVTLALAS